MKTLSVLTIVFSLLSTIVLSIILISARSGDIVFERDSTVILVALMLLGSVLGICLGVLAFFKEHSVFCTPPDARHCRKLIYSEYNCDNCKWKVK